MLPEFLVPDAVHDASVEERHLLPAFVCKPIEFVVIRFHQDNSIDEPSQFVSGQRRKILFAIQKLFVTLQEMNTRATNTEELTNSFGWIGNEAFQ